ncbi:RING-type domain-containing protein [Mycena chlorophos]|uniref:RING-type domain-containing protein n=1 Tax=Mycena chlorophos TaxID=658473 RepID=A0A8H6TLN5_MYCCL|nr:RING-type domain-containing protein [Mycena chlorophos]
MDLVLYLFLHLLPGLVCLTVFEHRARLGPLFRLTLRLSLAFTAAYVGLISLFAVVSHLHHLLFTSHTKSFFSTWSETTIAAFYHSEIFSPGSFLRAASVIVVYLAEKYQKERHEDTTRIATTEIAAAEQVLDPFRKVIERNLVEITKIRDSLTCPLCDKPYVRPQTLSPCGHTFDLACLQTHFRNAPPSPFDLSHNIRRLPAREKRCPTCNTCTMAEPAPAWFVKMIVDTASPPDVKIVPMHEGDDADGDDTYRVDPWLGIYREKEFVPLVHWVATFRRV